MTAIKAIVRAGQIEFDRPLNFPDGTEVCVIPVSSIPPPIEDPAEDTPEAAAEWVRRYDAMEPFEFSEEDKARWEADRRADREFELANWDKRSKEMEDLFP